jgi:hypothetical protein
MGDTVHAHIYFRKKGEPAFRDLGTKEMNSVPSVGGKVLIDIDGKKVEARVDRVNEFVPHHHRAAPEPSIWLEAI